MNASAAQLRESDPIIERLEDQLGWYDRKSLGNQRAYKRIKIAEILAFRLRSSDSDRGQLSGEERRGPAPL
jgi:hypothetical protein